MNTSGFLDASIGTLTTALHQEFDNEVNLKKKVTWKE